ncbi:50S ribosomal protein L3 N(5)-glutamine methyltransferase [Marinicella gelatinilytica]|uniref:50S ribosomal protein L3 N(5)-glutamine methyltransferase n=1 Tax=Marinicella gelatinilytica TaxID=2996017 RepID=UPI0022609C3F|nr:50S ribosomal protein L3 N(5)-glutamine methyltransferase [Marinicella gelatinilytica]MCX7546042.1 50S ribosomal protein L3 N(5)-glutamine methyltransferase [Marinicella gelatinilytica]
MTLTQLFNQLLTKLSSADVHYGQGNATAEDDVILLLMAVLNVDFETLNQMADRAISASLQAQALDLMVKRIELQRPMAYIVGFSIFAGLKFHVDERVLIPRSPFAELIDKGFHPHMNIQEVDQVLDLCTGSGCIGLALAHYYPHTRVDLADLSAAALAVAEQNRQHLGLTDRCRLIESDLWQNIDQKYDLIISNPPYVSADEHGDLPAEFSHEPAMALVSPMNGLLLPIEILAKAANYLNSAGFLFLEVGYSDMSLQSMLPDVPFEWLEFDYGGQGICVFNRQDLIKYQPYFVAVLESHVA